MADFVRASHPVFGTRMIPSTWLTMYPGVWTELPPDDPGTGPDPLSIYVRDVDLPAAMDAVAADLESAFSVRQRAASVAALEDAATVAPTGAWDFAQAPTVAGVAIGTGGGGAVPDATTTIKGIVELATNAETTTGTDTARAVTPAGLAAAIAGKANAAITQTIQTGTAYTLALVDAGTIVELTSAAAVNVTVPPNSAVAYPVGTTIALRQYGAGEVTVVPDAGVIVRSRGAAMKLTAQYSEAALTKRAADEWVLSGDVTT